MTLTWSSASVRELERSSIRAFVEAQAGRFHGRVLDLGCGKQPYRDIVEAAGAEYVPYDRTSFDGNVSGEDIGEEIFLRAPPAFDVVLVNQVIQYVPRPAVWLVNVAALLRPGTLVMTYPCNWDWIEPDDRWRFTPAGMADLLTDAGMEVLESAERAAIELGGFRFPLGYGVVASCA